MELTVGTVRFVPAGIVAAFKDDATKHGKIIAITATNLFRVISASMVDTFGF
jgi:hypothetical protein